LSDVLSKTIDITIVINPQCPDSASLVKKIEEITSEFSEGNFNIRTFNIWQDYNEFINFLKSCKIIKTVDKHGKIIKPIQGLIFVNGKEVSGIPLDERKVKYAIMEEISKDDFVVSDLGIDIGSVGWFAKPRKNFDIKKVKLELVNEDNVRYLVDLCLKYNPTLGEAPEREDSNYFLGLKMKLSWLNEIWDTFGPNAILAFFEDQPLGFIEFLPSALAEKVAAICSGLNREKTITILCLLVRKNFQNLGIGTKLVKKLEKYAAKRGYRFLEVGAFLGETSWHPESFYRKLGFRKVIGTTIGNRCIMRKKIIS